MKKISSLFSPVTGSGLSSRLTGIAIIFTGFVALLVASGCSEPGPYVELDGKKLTESDLKSDAPDEYASLKKQHNAQLMDLLQEFANQKILQAEAKKEGKSVDEYVKSLVSRSPMPSNAEIEATYKQLKGAGQVNAPLEEIRGQLMQYMIRNNEREFFQKEMARLRKEHGFHVPADRVEVDVAGEPSIGDPNAKVTIIEFSDFECPFCRKAQTVNRELRNRYGDKIHWVFKDFPLNFHANAMNAHKAANCVGTQKPDKFWTFFDSVFEKQATGKEILQKNNLRALASTMDIDMKKYDSCLEDPAMDKEIQNDIDQGQSVGVTGTPAFFINGRMISGARPLEDFVTIIEEEI